MTLNNLIRPVYGMPAMPIEPEPVIVGDEALPVPPLEMARGTKQDYGSPREFILAIEKRFGPIACDLAARIDNTVAREFISPEADSLKQEWAELYPTGTLYLNPPFAHIEPWAKKCAAESKKRLGWIVMLVPASAGSLWFHRHVVGHAHWDGIPRMQFVGADHLYPKDLMICAYGYGVHGSGYWDWREKKELAE